MVKLLDASVHHKHEVGGVHLDVVDAEGLDRALGAIGRFPVLVEAQLPPGPDWLVGGAMDPAYGPILAVGPGGRTWRRSLHRPSSCLP